MILDTCFLIDIMRKEQKAVALLHELIKKGEHPLVTALSVFELFSGLQQSSMPLKEKERILSVLSGQLIVAFDEASAQRAGLIYGDLIRGGKDIGPLDCMIAGIALEKKEKVLTRNAQHFLQIAHLEVHTY